MTEQQRGISNISVRGIPVPTLNQRITVLAFDTRQDMTAALKALARATNIRRVNYANGTEQVTTCEDRDIWLWVNKSAQSTDPEPADEG